MSNNEPTNLIPTYRLLSKPSELFGVSFPFLIFLFFLTLISFLSLYIADHLFIGIVVALAEYLIVRVLYAITPNFFSILKNNLFIIKPNTYVTKKLKVFTWTKSSYNKGLDYAKIDKQISLLINARTKNR